MSKPCVLTVQLAALWGRHPACAGLPVPLWQSNEKCGRAAWEAAAGYQPAPLATSEEACVSS